MQARILFILVLLLVCAGAQAQSYPSRPIHLLVPSPAGSSPDIRARQIGTKLTEALGQPVVVENRVGGNGIVAAREAARAAPDGYTVILAVINNALLDALKPDPCCRLNEELVPVSRFTMTPLLVVANPGLEASSVAQLLERARSRPGSVSFGSAGPGSVSQFVGAWLGHDAGVQMLEVPYKAVNAELPDLMAGRIMVAFPVPQVVAASIRSGKLRALAVLGPSRISLLPDVPTAAEAGLPGMEAIVWNGVFVPKGTPRPVIEVLHRELVRAYNAPEIRKQVTDTGSEVAADTPEEFAAFVRAEQAKWSKVIRDAGIKPE